MHGVVQAALGVEARADHKTQMISLYFGLVDAGDFAQCLETWSGRRSELLEPVCDNSTVFESEWDDVTDGAERS